MRRLMIFLAALLLLSPTLAVAESVIVKALKASIKATPSVQARTIAEARRDDVLQVVKKEGSWYLVQLPDNRTGWVFEYSVAPTGKVAKKDDLFEKTEKPSRIRVTEATSAGSIRGLSRVARVYAESQGFEDEYIRAVEVMQQYSVTEGEVERFLREGQVGGR